VESGQVRPGGAHPAGRHRPGAGGGAIRIEITEAGRRWPSPRRFSGQGFDVAAGRRFPAHRPSGVLLHLDATAGQHLLVTHHAAADSSQLVSTPEPWAMGFPGTPYCPGVTFCPAAGLSQAYRNRCPPLRPSDFPPLLDHRLRPHGARPISRLPLAAENPRFSGARPVRRYPPGKARVHEATARALCGTDGLPRLIVDGRLQAMPVISWIPGLLSSYIAAHCWAGRALL